VSVVCPGCGKYHALSREGYVAVLRLRLAILAAQKKWLR
jgi:hypothetical protein